MADSVADNVVSEGYMNQFRVTFGTAVSVTRAVHTHTEGRIEASTAPVIVNGTTYSAGSSGGGTITTTNTTWENAIVIAEDGNEYPVKIQVQEPFLREGSDVALTLRNGTPVVVTNLNSKYRYWINGGPEPEFAGKWWVWFWFIVGLMFLVPTFLIPQTSYENATRPAAMLAGFIMIGVGVMCTVWNRKNEAKRMAHQAKRTAYLNGEINKRIPGWS